MPKSYPPEFRRKVLDLLDAGRKVADVAADLGVTQASIYIWRRQHLIDTGRMPGITS
ncbi:MAG: transposase, partial [Ilumatobacteraceae bacterium]